MSDYLPDNHPSLSELASFAGEFGFSQTLTETKVELSRAGQKPLQAPRTPTGVSSLTQQVDEYRHLRDDGQG